MNAPAPSEVNGHPAGQPDKHLPSGNGEAQAVVAAEPLEAAPDAPEPAAPRQEPAHSGSAETSADAAAHPSSKREHEPGSDDESSRKRQKGPEVERAPEPAPTPAPESAPESAPAPAAAPAPPAPAPEPIPAAEEGGLKTAAAEEPAEEKPSRTAEPDQPSGPAAPIPAAKPAAAEKTIADAAASTEVSGEATVAPDAAQDTPREAPRDAPRDAPRGIVPDTVPVTVPEAEAAPETRPGPGRTTVDSSAVLADVATLPRRTLGSVIYEPGSLLASGHELDLNGVLQVSVSHAYLSQEYLRQNGSPLARRKLWGTQVYTDDSDLIAVLAHEGLLPSAAEGGKHDLLVELVILPVLEKYTGSYRHGVFSRDWHSRHDGVSYMVLGKPRKMEAGWSYSGIKEQQMRMWLLADARLWDSVDFPCR